ncbi:hypothetical protein PPACK8108_LOCUS22048 [Phakopsora pachyrhizi]|uniref:Tet-like 2OG-Fe(II) oxygenase domain-containing protein n=1 Tax=Phakopsora pachyrhizi TaxID=170000 RepID=A0AAV0BKZ0_PHAPC|nr:hypothetical protein PPACK8108_LOCUS22048 [Phakopsora pachyrhizi]
MVGKILFTSFFTIESSSMMKAQAPNQIVGRYIYQTKIYHKVKKNELNQDEEVAGVFQEIASVAYKSCKSYLEEHSLPLLSQMNFNQKDNYCPEDFSSAIIYTINHFSNKDHVDNDSDNWTLIGFIPVRKNGKLAYKDFDVEGGEFVIRDLRAFIELPKVEGIPLVVLKTSELKHQTLHSKSISDLFTRFGFSCQISKNMTTTMENFHNHDYEGINYTFGNYNNYIKKANEK